MSLSTENPATSVDTDHWQRLSQRVVWIDLAWSVLALLPGVVAVVFFNISPTWNSMWPLMLIAIFGILSAVGDITRWAFTRYRITDHDVQRRTGIFVKEHRKMPRDRIRSVDTHAKLRHRLAGLRIVTIGAGQQTASGESALVLDALSKAEAQELRQMLLNAPQKPTAPDTNEDDDDAAFESEAPEAEHQEVFATFKASWVVYNMFSIWAYLLAAGLLWGASWFLTTFEFDLYGYFAGLIDWQALGWVGITVVILVVVGAFGALGMGVNYFTAYWNFELSRVHAGGKSYLRTRRGLFSTHEVSRDEARMRGMTIGEPVLWRWMGMADTNVITTGLSIWSAEQPTAILPRGPVSVAREAARQALGGQSPLEVSLPRHPRAALRRRLWWSTLIGLAPAALVLYPALSGAVPIWVLWAVLGVLPISLLGGAIAYQSLGHAISGDYLVVRAGLTSRSTSALRRDAVSTIALRQSVLQKRLGLCSVSAMTAAGWGAYEALDINTEEGVGFAREAAPGLIDEFITAAPAR